MREMPRAKKKKVDSFTDTELYVMAELISTYAGNLTELLYAIDEEIAKREGVEAVPLQVEGELPPS
jgi:hypothetical protein